MDQLNGGHCAKVVTLKLWNAPNGAEKPPPPESKADPQTEPQPGGDSKRRARSLFA